MKNRTARSSRKPLCRRLFVEALESRDLLNATPAKALLFQFRPDAIDHFGPLAHAAEAQGLVLATTGIDGLFRATGDPDALDRLQAKYQGDGALAFVQADTTVSVALVPNDPGYTDGSLYGLSSTFGVQGPSAWDFTTGSSRVVIADIDTGVNYAHVDLYLNTWINQGEIPAAVRANLQDLDSDGLITFYDLNDARNQGAGKITDLDADGRITGRDLLRLVSEGGWADGLRNDGDNYTDDLVGWDFVNNDNDPLDDHGHGTHTVGTIAAIGNNATGVVGVAWRAQVMALKFLGANGSGSSTAAAAAVRYAVDHGARTSSNSWGGGGFNQALFDAIAYADANNHLFIAAAGNSGANNDATPFYPANYSTDNNGVILRNVVSVAATDSAGNRAGFSNYGRTTVDLGAPGVNIFSTLRNGGYGHMSGTSMATPHVAGVVALVLAQEPALTDNEVISRLLATVTPVASLNGLTVSGGIVNAFEALRAGNSGLRVIASTPTGQSAGPVDRVRLTFSREIQIGSFTTADVVAFTGPAGALTPTAVNRLDAFTYEVTFAAQTATGSYSLTVGPNILDTVGRAMDQDRDGIFGEAIDDRYTATFQVAAAAPPPAVQVIDDGGAGFSTAGSWDSFVGLGRDNDFTYSASGTGGDTASWAFTVTPGRYRVSTTWVARANRAADAPYTILDGATALSTIDVDQRQGPNDFSDAGTPWEDLATVAITGTTLTVRLTDDAGAEYVIADAVRIERVGDLVQNPEIEVLDGTTNIVDGTGSVAFGTVVEGNPVSKTFTVRNQGTATLTLGPSVSVPTGFTLTAGLGSTSLAPGASTTFTVRLDAVTAGTYSGEVSFANNDADEAPFNFTVTGTINPAPAPEIQVLDGTTNIVDGTGSVGFGTVVEGNPVSKTFTVRNQGTATLTLGPSVSVPTGFTLTAGLGSTSLAPGASTTFSVRLDAVTAGTYSGEVSFANNDADEAPFNFTVTGTVTAAAPPAPTVQVIDDGGAGFSTTGSWDSFVGLGRDNDFTYSLSGTGGDTASWAFTVTPGRYRVSTTWVARPNRAADAPYTILDGATALSTVDVDQRQGPNDFSDAGSAWEDLATVAITGTTLTVRLTDDAGAEYVIADAVRIERVGDLVQGPEIEVLDGTTNIVDGTGSVAFGNAAVGGPISKTFTVRNQGTATLTLGPSVSVPTGFTLTAGLGSTSLAPGASTTFSVRLDAVTAGTYSGEVSFANNDADEAPFNFTVTGTVAVPASVQIIDDGAAGFSTTGSWDSFVGLGRDNDFTYSLSGTGADTASWAFTVTPGRYRVSTTWVARPNRAADAPYTILDGATTLSTIDVDQRQGPNDFSDAGSAWEDLATVAITGTTLTVRLTDDAGAEYVIADAVRIERVGDLP